MEKIERITEILYAEIETESGQKLGRVFDFRAHGEPEHGFTSQEREIGELLYGERSFWEVLGFQKLKVKSVAWGKVIKFANGKIIVAEDALAESEKKVV